MFSKMYVLSNTEYRCLIADTLEDLNYEKVTKENIEEISKYIWESYIESEDVDGFMIVDKQGDWNEIWSVKRLEDFILYEEVLKWRK